MIAAHLLDAYRAAAGDADKDELRKRALAALRRGAQRAATVGGLDASERALRTAIELAVSEREQTELTEEAGRIAAAAGRYEAARDLFERAASAHAAASRERDAARLAGSIGHAQGRLGRHEEAITRMRAALDVLGTDDRDPDVAAINCDLGRALLFTGHLDEAGAAIERALGAAEALELPVLTCQALGLKAIHLEYVGRYEEARTLHDGAIAMGERHKVPRRHVALQNASVLRITQDMPGAVESCEAALAAARQRGDRSGESIAICNLMTARLMVGQWQEVERIGEGALDDDPGAARRRVRAPAARAASRPPRRPGGGARQPRPDVRARRHRRRRGAPLLRQPRWPDRAGRGRSRSRPGAARPHGPRGRRDPGGLERGHAPDLGRRDRSPR